MDFVLLAPLAVCSAGAMWVTAEWTAIPTCAAAAAGAVGGGVEAGAGPAHQEPESQQGAPGSPQSHHQAGRDATRLYQVQR